MFYQESWFSHTKALNSIALGFNYRIGYEKLKSVSINRNASVVYYVYCYWVL